MKNLVIFGTGEIAQLAHYYFCHDSTYKVVGFAVDSRYKTSDSFCSLPVVTTEELTARFPPAQNAGFVAMSYSGMNHHRQTKYEHMKSLGYQMVSYVSTQCTNFSSHIGENCFILEDNTLQPFTTIGDNVTLWSGNHIGHHSTIKDHCFLASHIVVSGGVTVENNCFIGVNVTLRDHVKIGARTLIGAGALIVKDTRPGEVYKGVRSQPENKTSDEVEKI